MVVSFNNAADLSECLASLDDSLATSPIRHEVVVFDNASSDDTTDSLRHHFPSTRLIESEVNLGFGRACNRAVAQTHGEFVLLLNPDTEMLDGTIEALLDLAARHPEAGLYGGRTVSTEGELDPRSAWGAPTLWSLICFGTGLSAAASGSARFDPESLPGWDRDTEREVPVVTGCLLLPRRTTWDELDGFDERFFLYGEDADLSMRAWRAGYRPRITPDATIVHALGRSSSDEASRWIMVMRGKATLVRTHWTGPQQRLGIAMLWSGVLLRAVLGRLTRRLRRSPVAPYWGPVWKARRSWLPGWGEPDGREVNGGNALSADRARRRA